jgi:hypothetical protein
LEHSSDSSREEGEHGDAGIIVSAFGGWKGRDTDHKDSNSGSEDEIEEVMNANDSLSRESVTSHLEKHPTARAKTQAAMTNPQKNTVAHGCGHPAKTVLVLEAPEGQCKCSKQTVSNSHL